MTSNFPFLLPIHKWVSSIRLSKIKKGLILTVYIPALLSFSCGTIKVWTAKSLMEDVEKATLKSTDPELVTESMPTLLLLLETLLNEHPTNNDLLLKATKAYTSYGTLLQYKETQKARKQFNRARQLGQAAFERDSSIYRLLNAPYAEFTSISTHLEASDGPLVFWLASSWGSWIYTNTGSLTALADLPKVIFLMEWVIEWNESYEHGAPHLFLGAYYAALPPMLGGNPHKSLHHFDRSEEISQGKALLVPTMKAQYLARQTFDKTMHDSLLNSVVNAPETLDSPLLKLQNELARNIAHQLLSESDAFFY